MDIIVHRIRLRESVPPERFEKWVTEVDYAACPRLPSVASFSVQRIAGEGATAPEYFEVITVRGLDAFERDTRSDAFRQLASEFDELAEVIEEVSGERVGPGYAAA
ncbi:RedY protein [Streptomyces violascens]|uniref:RedY protein n=1 Tax=Streptomyces violascens TaxID=67381 RepID=UPI00378B5100